MDSPHDPTSPVEPLTGRPASGEPDALEVAAQLTAALNGMATQLAEVKKDSEERDEAEAAERQKRVTQLKRYGRTNRYAIVLDVALTIAIALLAWQDSGTAGRADQATAHAAAATAADKALHAAQISGCESGNEQRAGELALWTYLFHASKPPSAAQAAAIAKFMILVKSTFAAHDCPKVYSLTPAPKAKNG